MTLITNRLFDQLEVGDTASTKRILQIHDVRAWAAAFGAIGARDEDGDRQGAVSVLTAILTALVASDLPAAGSTILSVAVTLAESEQLNLIDTPLNVSIMVTAVHAPSGRVSLSGQVADASGQPVICAERYKNLAFMADAQTAGLVVGARVPIILTSRADTADARRFSAAAAVLDADALAKDGSMLTPEVAE